MQASVYDLTNDRLGPNGDRQAPCAVWTPRRLAPLSIRIFDAGAQLLSRQRQPTMSGQATAASNLPRVRVSGVRRRQVSDTRAEATAVIGSGFAGLAAAGRLAKAGREVVVFEARPYWGGHTHTRNVDGFLFDEGPHVSFTTDETVKEAFADGAGDVVEFAARITNFFRGTWLTHPAQVHLFGVDTELITKCITDFVEAQHNPPEIKTYADWLIAMYGATFAEHFPFAYTRKYWTVEADQLGVDWIGARMYPPKLAEVVQGALEPDQAGDFHYLKKFRYPSAGGYQSFMRALYDPDRVHVNKGVVEIEPCERVIRFRDGTSTSYEHLISTMPLPDLIAAIPHAPHKVRQASEALLCTSVVLVDVAIRRDNLSDHHWLYVYDEDISFARAHFPHMLSPGNAPQGMGSVQCEVYYSRNRALPSPPTELASRVVDELVRLEILRDPNEVLFAEVRDVRYANVVFDHHRQPALDIIVPWVESQGIVLAGRFGEWGYHWTDDATRSGWAAAEFILNRGQV